MMNRSTTQIRLLVAVLVSILSFSFAKAEASDSNLPDSKGWYLGMDGGLPFGLSTFSSFGHDKTHLGWAAGIYGGYRFNPIFSAELSARYGEVNLSAQDCCVERNYWLGSDGILYKAGVLGMDSWEYAQLKSHVRMGWYGARVHVNLLGLLRNTAHSRWTVAVSPHLYAVTTCADIQTLADHAEVMKGSTRWHLGYGASLQAGYQLTSNLNLGIYSGLTRLSGERMDGMPEHLHKNNFVWESGIRLGISFSKKKNKIVETPSVPQTEVLHQDTILSENVNQKEKETEDKAETKVVEQDIKEPVKVTFPVIYFSFNRITIRPSEVSKLKSILHILKENPDMKVMVTGWCDTRGSVAVNRRISRQRAQALKTWLVKRGIAARRISVVGKGSDASRTAPKARRVETTNIIRKTKCYRFTKRNVPKRKTKCLRYRGPPEPYSNSVRTDFFSYSNAIILENLQTNTSI